MIKYLKNLWKKWFGKKEVLVVKPIPQPIPRPKPLHCNTHSRFKKSCPDCLTVVGVR